MKTAKFIRAYMFLFITTLITGCKLAVVVVEGGEVLSDKSGNTCLSGTICLVDVKNTYFDETFIAVPHDGWYFHKWNSGDGFFCGDRAIPKCELAFTGFENNEALHEIIETSEALYLMPIFKDYPRVITGNEPRTITADGKKQSWLQPAEFIGYSYDQIAGVCPDSHCTGTLPGSAFDLTGYIWASRQDVELLFLAYWQADNSFGGDFDPTDEIKYPTTRGIVRDRPKGPNEILIIGVTRSGNYSFDKYDPTDESYSFQSSLIGAWFWRPLD